MKVLVACEESQRVCTAFRERGHEAYSCDIVECSGGHPEWHIRGDVLRVLNPEWHDGRFGITPNINFYTENGECHQFDGKWDMIIAFPPCTHLAVSGARHFEKKRADGRQKEGIQFFCNFLTADCDKIVIENPIGVISGDYVSKWFPDLAEEYGLPKKPSQIIQPWMFGDNYNKTTCLWIKGLPDLVTQCTTPPEMEWKEWIDKKTGRKKRQNKLYYDIFCECKTSDERSRLRSKTFPGVAKAMAEQWG